MNKKKRPAIKKYSLNQLKLNKKIYFDKMILKVAVFTYAKAICTNKRNRYKIFFSLICLIPHYNMRCI